MKIIQIAMPSLVSPYGGFKRIIVSKESKKTKANLEDDQDEGPNLPG
jgi:hypothetical protein